MTEIIHQVVVDARGFSENDWHSRERFISNTIKSLDAKSLVQGVLMLTPDQAAEDIMPLPTQINAIEILFPSSHDGRGFSLARRLRQLGYQGVLRSSGNIYVDQMRHHLQCGIDAILLSEDQSKKMPEKHWLEASKTVSRNYQRHLGMA